MIYLICLAAGRGRRFGADKLLTPWQGRPLYAWGLATLAAACAGRTDARLIVVTNTPAIAESTRALGGEAVPSPESEKGQSFSIRAGLDALPPLQENDFLLFGVADQPLLRVETVRRLLDTAAPGVFGATVAAGDRVGSPALFSAALAPALRALEGDRGGRGVLNAHPERVLRVECDPEELRDIDRPEDLARLSPN